VLLDRATTSSATGGNARGAQSVIGKLAEEVLVK
jgi:hypothetical protein